MYFTFLHFILFGIIFLFQFWHYYVIFLIHM
jgi:hypothetical protein